MNKIGKRIKLARVYRNYTQEYMAEEMQIAQSTYSRIESGSIVPDVERLIQIAGLLNVKLDYFLNESETDFL